MFKQRRVLIITAIIVFFVISLTSGAVGYRLREVFNLGNTSLPLSNPSEKTVEREVVSEESTVTKVVKKVSPSVVSIAVSRRITDPFSNNLEPTGRESGIGTGFIISKDGLILTNRHVVSENDLQYIVITKDDKKYTAQRIFRDPALDIAIIKVDALGLEPVDFGDSSKLEVGQIAIAVGNALGRFKNTVTTGVISGIRSEGLEAGDPLSGMTERLGEVIQTDAAINPGNSGGPLLDSSGRVIGVNVAVTQGAQNIGFAIPINTIKPVIEEFMRTGKISRPYLGVRYEMISRTRALAFEVPEGAYVREVIAGSPAEKAGVKVADIILRLGGQTINTENPLSKIIQGKKIGDQLEIVVDRDDQEMKFNVTLGENPAQF